RRRRGGGEWRGRGGRRHRGGEWRVRVGRRRRRGRRSRAQRGLGADPDRGGGVTATVRMAPARTLLPVRRAALRGRRAGELRRLTLATLLAVAFPAAASGAPHAVPARPR